MVRQVARCFFRYSSITVIAALPDRLAVSKTVLLQQQPGGSLAVFDPITGYIRKLAQLPNVTARPSALNFGDHAPGVPGPHPGSTPANPDVFRAHQSPAYRPGRTGAGICGKRAPLRIWLLYRRHESDAGATGHDSRLEILGWRFYQRENGGSVDGGARRPAIVPRLRARIEDNSNPGLSLFIWPQVQESGKTGLPNLYRGPREDHHEPESK
jgi:hypothetical protein